MRQVLTPLIGVVTFCALLLALLFWFVLFFLPAALLKLLPVAPLRRAMTGVLVWVVGRGWASTNRAVLTLLHGRRDGYRIDPGVDMAHSWLLLSNHQSWADILILVDALGGRAPCPRFFLKRQLIWVPMIGFAAWALDMPFMKRHSREAVAANPRLARDDLEATRRACQRYRMQPVTLVNFVEGTRGSAAKRRARRSPYRYLLRPKSGGLAFALNAMGDQLAGVLDVTIAYRPARRGLLWSFLCGEQAGVQLRLRRCPIPDALRHGDYQGDAEFRRRFQDWVGEIWAEKDAELAQLARYIKAGADAKSRVMA